jgi:hypothetical protein
MPKLKIFISYRRDDSAPYAGRVSDQLKRHFRVFIDVDSLEAGDHFRDAIEQYVTSCDVLIAVIGPRWMDADDTGKRRLDEENDLVRLEIATALRRGIRVVPGLVGAAKMPSGGFGERRSVRIWSAAARRRSRSMLRAGRQLPRSAFQHRTDVE